MTEVYENTNEKIQKILGDLSIKNLENTNFINEKVYKKAHIETWSFIIDELIKYQNLKEKGDCKNTTLADIKIKAIKKLRDSVQKGKETYEITVKNIFKNNDAKIRNDCWACQFAYRVGSFTICDKCPLLVKNKGNLKFGCCHSSSIYLKLCDLIKNHDFKKAIDFAEEIKNAWREVK